MKLDAAPTETMEIYLLRVKQKLQDLPGAQVSEILAELRSHILDSTSSTSGEIRASAIHEVLNRLGSPDALAEMYLTENLMERAETSHSPWLVMRTLFRLAINSLWALGVFLVSLTGYLVATGFFICAVGKPFNPDRDGLWWNTQSHSLVGIGFIWPEQFDRELLGWWIIPVGLLTFALVFFLTTRFARWNIRRIRRFRKAPFAPPGAERASRSAS